MSTLGIKPVMLKTTFLSSALNKDATEIVVDFLEDIGGNKITNISTFGTKGVMTISPKTDNEEVITFTSVTELDEGKVELGGVQRGMRPVDPYEPTTEYAFQHSASAECIFSNPPEFYEQFVSVDGNFTLGTGAKAEQPIDPKGIANKEYVDNLAYGSVSQKEVVLDNMRAGQNISENDIVYFNPSVNSWVIADNEIPGIDNPNLLFGIANENGTSGNAFDILVLGVKSNFSGLTDGEEVYLTSNGNVSTTAPANGALIQIGTAKGTSEVVMLDTPINEKVSDALQGSVGVPSILNKFVTQQNLGEKIGDAPKRNSIGLRNVTQKLQIIDSNSDGSQLTVKGSQTVETGSNILVPQLTGTASNRVQELQAPTEINAGSFSGKIVGTYVSPITGSLRFSVSMFSGTDNPNCSVSKNGSSAAFLQGQEDVQSIRTADINVNRGDVLTYGFRDGTRYQQVKFMFDYNEQELIVGGTSTNGGNTVVTTSPSAISGINTPYASDEVFYRDRANFSNGGNAMNIVAQTGGPARISFSSNSQGTPSERVLIKVNNVTIHDVQTNDTGNSNAQNYQRTFTVNAGDTVRVDVTGDQDLHGLQYLEVENIPLTQANTLSYLPNTSKRKISSTSRSWFNSEIRTDEVDVPLGTTMIVADADTGNQADKQRVVLFPELNTYTVGVNGQNISFNWNFESNSISVTGDSGTGGMSATIHFMQ